MGLLDFHNTYKYYLLLI